MSLGKVSEETAADRINSALSVARRLVRYGVPVFPARVDDDGNPDRDDRRWARWNKYPADEDILQGYRRGDALCAVCGVTFDVIDIDPRNGGKFSFRRMSDELADFGPVVYGKAKTPSGGMHLYIAALGIGSHNGIMPGIDLKGGNPDGTGRGFVFIPPTIRPVKGLEGEGGVITGDDAVDRVRLGTYRWIDPVQKPGGDSSSEELTAYILSAIEEQRSRPRPNNPTSGRESPDRLRKECIDAEAGGQRGALLRYVHELERKGYEKKDIITLLHGLCQEMPVFDTRRPWYPVHTGNPDRELLTLFHRPGTIIPDATLDEAKVLESLDGPSVARVVPSGLTSFADVDRQLSTWLWMRYLAIGDITILDGDAGNGKSLVTLDWGARITRGDEMPDGTMPGMRGSVLLLAPEDSDSTTAGRLEAAGADMQMVFRPTLTMRKKRGQKESKAYSGNELVSFPNSTPKVIEWIRSYAIKLVIVDPIAAFLGEDINSNNDASVRRALAPLSQALGHTGSSSVFIRHYNKNAQLAAAHRGGGSVAFGAVSRIQLVSGIVPDESRSGIEIPDDGQVFAISQVKNNHLKRRPDEGLAYTIEDSDVVADMDGNKAPKIRWLGVIMVSPDELASSSGRKRGPNPLMQTEIGEVLAEMFSTSPTWDAVAAMAEIRSAGISANKETIAKTRQRMGIIARPRRESGRAGVKGWEWTLPTKNKVGEDSE